MKKHGLTIGIITIALILIFGLFGGFYYYLNYVYIPDGLTMDGYDHIADIGPNHQYVINYPSCNDYQCELIYTGFANGYLKIMETNGSTMESITIEIHDLNGDVGYMDLTDNIHDTHTMEFVDMTTHTVIDKVQFSDDFLRMLRQDFIQQARNDDRYAGVSYTSAFANGITKETVVETISWNDPIMVFTNDFGYGELSVSKDMRYFNDALNFALCNESMVETIRYGSTRRVDPYRKSIVLMVAPSLNRSLDDQWIELLDHYGASATFYMYGYSMEGNDDLIHSLLNHNIELGSLGMYGSIADLSDQQADEEMYGPLRILESISDHGATMETYLDLSNTLDNSDYPLTVITCDDYITSVDGLTSAINGSSDSMIYLVVQDNASLLTAMESFIPTMMDQGYQWISVSEALNMK